MVVSEVPKKEDFKGYMSGEIPVPKYQPVSVVKPEKDGELYPQNWPHLSHSEVDMKVDEMMGSLSLFAPRALDDECVNPEMLLERPVTPINEEIKSPPTSFNQLVKFVRRRIAAKKERPYLSIEDQQNLAGILMAEVNGIWREVKKQVDDPFMSAEQNRELNRRISVYIVTVCERLFKHYLDKAIVLNSRGVFSGPANMCRLRAQLALDANKLLNILTVRRYIVSDMRGQDKQRSQQSVGITQATPLSFTSLMDCIRPKSGTKRNWRFIPTAEIDELCEKMPDLDTGKLLKLLQDLPEPVTDRTTSEDMVKVPSIVSEMECDPSKLLEEISRKLVLRNRSHSVPFLRGFGETLLEELDIEDDKLGGDVTYDVTDLIAGTKHDKSHLVKERGKKSETGVKRIENDLHQLLARSKEIDENMTSGNDEEGLPPLLQALTRAKKHDGVKERLRRQLRELERQQWEDEQNERVVIPEPIHPQPATVTSKPNTQMPVKTSDIRVSERVCMSSMTLESYATVYNDLQDEISNNMISQLDKNLFLEDEIKEVYKEVMKSIPTEHLKLEQCDMVMPSADQIDLSTLMPSATLNRRKGSRLINPQLERHADPPWGEMGVKDWVKTPLSPPKNVKGEDQFPPVTPNLEKIGDILKAKNNEFKISENIPPAVAEKMARTYASWFQWWKNTTSTDDYMKYISTQDTDFLGVSYHFYDSDDADGVDDPSPSAAMNPHSTLRAYRRKSHSKDSAANNANNAAQVLNLEKEKKLNDLKSQKSEYKEGFWNVNTVLMGGLGNDPVIEDKEEVSQRETPESDSSRRAKQTLKARAQARQSAKSHRSEARRPSTVTSPITESMITPSRTSSPHVPEKPLSPQERLERVWNALHMPDRLRLDMAIKYSGNEYYKLLEEAMEKWEEVAHFILQRETILGTLEKFERTASDPNRFFVKGHKGSSVARLDEARERSYYYRKIEDLEEDIKLELDFIKNNFNDEVSFKGRPYLDKMKWDRVEMLYWLGEERKHNAIKYENMMKAVPLKTTHLDPLLLESRG